MNEALLIEDWDLLDWDLGFGVYQISDFIR
jgi:hypothetical protein